MPSKQVDAGNGTPERGGFFATLVLKKAWERPFHMMTLPFFICAVAIWLSWRGHRFSALVATLIAVVVLFALYRLHATDALNLDL